MRPACREDEPLLFELFAGERRVEFAAAGVPQMQAEMLAQMQYRGRAMSYSAQFPEAEDSILIVEDGTPVGRLLVDRKSERWRVVDIAVLAEHRGRGVARKALIECQVQCAIAGTKLELEVATQNPARRLYEQLGFRVTGEDMLAVRMAWSAGE
jgi:ribosomal protein S18 acetylase RimI-like enzyme